MTPPNRTPQPESIDPWGRLKDLHSRTLAAVAAANSLDTEQPTAPSAANALRASEAAYTRLFEAERLASTRYASMVANAEKQIREHEVAVRRALETGDDPPTPPDADLVKKILDEERSSRLAGYPPVEAAAGVFVRAAKDAAGARALLLALKLRPIVASYQPTSAALQAAEERASGDGGLLEREFKKEGWL